MAALPARSIHILKFLYGHWLTGSPLMFLALVPYALYLYTHVCLEKELQKTSKNKEIIAY